MNTVDYLRPVVSENAIARLRFGAYVMKTEADILDEMNVSKRNAPFTYPRHARTQAMHLLDTARRREIARAHLRKTEEPTPYGTKIYVFGNPNLPVSTWIKIETKMTQK